MYKYSEVKPRLFTDEGQRLFLSIRDKSHGLIKQAGAARMQEMITGNTGSTWDFIACVDRMVELGEIREITCADTPGQYRVFVTAKHEF